MHRGPGRVSAWGGARPDLPRAQTADPVEELGERGVACTQRAITADRQAGQAEREHQEQDQAVPEQKAGGWLSRFRT
ncbi:hypothetical protein ABT115_26270 [Streptomyces sp. NPDC001832]|uniref:hypothetical protein n=1 Tax=Streptomyces sp. NPDC001832 TaxID=3154527 RepID=UPI00332520CB